MRVLSSSHCLSSVELFYRLHSLAPDASLVFLFFFSLFFLIFSSLFSSSFFFLPFLDSRTLFFINVSCFLFLPSFFFYVSLSVIVRCRVYLVLFYFPYSDPFLLYYPCLDWFPAQLDSRKAIDSLSTQFTDNHDIFKMTRSRKESAKNIACAAHCSAGIPPFSINL